MSYLIFNNWENLKKLPGRRIQSDYLLLGFVMCCTAILLTFYRWYLLVWAQDIPFRVRDAVRLGFIGYLLNYISAGAVGGDILKAALIAKEQTERRGIAAATVFVDRIMGLLGLLMVASVVCFIPTKLLGIELFQKMKMSYLVATAIGLTVVILLMIPAVPRSRLVQSLVKIPLLGRFAGGIINAILLYQTRWFVIVVVVLISIAGHLIMLTSFHCCSAAFNDPDHSPGFVEHLQIIPAAELAGVVFPTPGGTGGLEGAIETFYLGAGYHEGDGFITGTAYRILSILIAFIGAGYYLISRKEIQNVMHEQEEETPANNAD